MMTFDVALCDGVTDPHSSGTYVKRLCEGRSLGTRRRRRISSVSSPYNTGDTGAAPEYLHMCQLSVRKQWILFFVFSPFPIQPQRKEFTIDISEAEHNRSDIILKNLSAKFLMISTFFFFFQKSNRNGDDGIGRLFTSNTSHYTSIVISASLLSRTRPQSKNKK